MVSNKRYSILGDEFVISDYNNSKAFSSFFPAIAGEWGKPMWCYYVNRGQAITCFGTHSKEGAILEFVAANKAYRQTEILGFRTFLKVNNTFYEPFKNSYDNEAKKITQTMYINSYRVKLVDRNESLGIECTAEFFTLPNEPFPALLKKLTIKNLFSTNISIECLDGLPDIIPYGTTDWQLKNMSRLAEGWYSGVFYSDRKRVPVYKLPVEPQDRPEIVPIKAANFYFGYYKYSGNIYSPKYFIDPDNVFGEVKNFSYPKVFISSNVKSFDVDSNLTGKNKTPLAMGFMQVDLLGKEEFTYYSAVSHATNYKNVDNFVTILEGDNFFEEKEEENKSLMKKMTEVVDTRSSMLNFDNYCKQNFIDNFLRGGYPLTLGSGENKKVYYTYSRVHGDMEREYNNFIVLPEYYSQGNGNYRDVNQNRRSDIFFNQDLSDDLIVFFMNLIQLDGFNPLKVLGVKFNINNINSFMFDIREQINEKLTGDLGESLEKIKKFITEPITIGSFFNFVEDNGVILKSKEAVLNSIIKYSEIISLANHAEGYWSDHWHYNIDLIESYLAIFPDKLEEILLQNNRYVFYDDCYMVEPRANKYVLVSGKPKQFNAVYKDEEKENLIKSRTNNPNIARTSFGKGDIYKTNLLNKLLSLLANKYSSLDPDCIGIEMETDKPNWCDALNGLPGIFGSSTAESLELLRLVRLLKEMLNNVDEKRFSKVKIMEETFYFLDNLYNVTLKNLSNFDFWDETHTIKENYREKTKFGISGNNIEIELKEIKKYIDTFLEKLNKSLSNDKIFNSDNIVMTSFEYVPTKYEVIDGKFSKKGFQNIKVLEFKRKDFPIFLEGPVHYLRLKPNSVKEFHKNLLNSDLYDKKLKMIKVNASLHGVDMNIGRISVFTPGWLENESVWLHMEYKYMLELLKNNLGKEFFDLAKTSLVPFMDPNVYGRSIFENSSFIVSSAHPEPNIHGQGFVSRLSGSTAEFISMWIAMTSGVKPFFMKNGDIAMKFTPQLPSYLFTEEEKVCEKTNEVIPKNIFSFKFLGKIRVIYINNSRKDVFINDENSAKIEKYILSYSDKDVEVIGDTIEGSLARDIRSGEINKIKVILN